MHTSDTVQWDLLHHHLLIFVVSAIISGALVHYSVAQFERADQSYRRERAQLDTWKRDYHVARQQEQMYRRHIDPFSQFIDAGYIGREQRLRWVEAIQDINAALKLPVLKYTISPQQVFIPTDTTLVPHDSLTVYESRMSLDLGLLHAGDLYAFLAALTARANSLFAVRGCDLTLVAGAPHLDGGHANVQALCELSWYTLRIVDMPQEIAAQ